MFLSSSKFAREKQCKATYTHSVSSGVPGVPGACGGGGGGAPRLRFLWLFEGALAGVSGGVYPIPGGGEGSAIMVEDKVRMFATNAWTPRN